MNSDSHIPRRVALVPLLVVALLLLLLLTDCAAHGAGTQAPATFPTDATPTQVPPTPSATYIRSTPTQTPIPSPTPLGGYGSNNPPPVSVLCPTNAELQPIVGNPEDVFSEGTIGNHTACSYETV